MSQYPPPPQGPQPPVNFNYYQPVADPLAPARRASVMMFVLGGLAVLAGLCFAGIASQVTADMFAGTPQAAQFEQIESQMGISLRTLFTIVGVVPLVIGVIFVGLGILVRQGGFGSIITALVLTGVSGLAMGFFVIAGVFQALLGGNPAAGGAVCVYGVPFLLLLVLFVWLMQAVRAASGVTGAAAAAAQQQYQAQMWAYQQQQQQAYGQQQQPQPPGGYGQSYPTPGAGTDYGYGQQTPPRSTPAPEAQQQTPPPPDDPARPS